MYSMNMSVTIPVGADDTIPLTVTLYGELVTIAVVIDDPVTVASS